MYTPVVTKKDVHLNWREGHSWIRDHSRQSSGCQRSKMGQSLATPDSLYLQYYPAPNSILKVLNGITK